ncbi:MAG: hypothetical protein AB7O67_23500 [Vicinamibacterales bacterium]
MNAAMYLEGMDTPTRKIPSAVVRGGAHVLEHVSRDEAISWAKANGVALFSLPPARPDGRPVTPERIA